MDLTKNVSPGKRIGILGGTFDPVHHGHLAVAEAVRAALLLDTVMFIPAALPPHKLDSTITPFSTRLAMLELALNGLHGFVASNLEGSRQGPSYTIDTLIALRNRLGPDVDFFFIIGIDAFAEIASWKEYRQLPDIANLAVIAERPDSNANVGLIVEQYYNGFTRADNTMIWTSPNAKGRIYAISMKPIAVSSTEVRRRLSEGLSVDALMPAQVVRYVREHALYTALADKGAAII